MQKNLPILIVGQGIAGTLLSFELWQHGIPFVVMDQQQENSSSIVSGAALNPYSGKTIKGTNRRSQMYNIAKQKYESIGAFLNKPILKPTPLLLFENEVNSKSEFDIEPFKNIFKTTTDISKFDAVALVDNVLLIESWRSWLLQNELLISEQFEESKINLDDDILHYDNQQYSKVVYCNGTAAVDSVYFSKLRFTENRGDVLLLKIPELDEQFIYQKDKLRLLPKGNQTFWCGSNYLWQYDNMQPNEAWKLATIQQLESWLKLLFETEAHLCAKRPTTAGQIPFVGWHPQFPQIGICNGLGTKGFSAGPMWITNFVAQSLLQNNKTIYQSVLDRWLM